MLKDSVTFEQYNPKWPEKANDEIRLLQMALPIEVIDSIQHIGSTAIPNMLAKPIIDLMIIVQDINAAKVLIPIIESLGYAHWYDNPKKDRLFFVKGLPEAGGSGRTHHLHIFQKNSYEYFAHQLFRDYLISQPNKKLAYAELKTKLALQYIGDREAYTSGKTDFVNQVSQDAMLSLMQFIPLSSTYFNTLHHWFNQPHVQEFYSLRSWTLNEIEKKLTPYLDKNYEIKGFLMLLDATPIAFFQYCYLDHNLWPDQDLQSFVVAHGVGIDFFIGEPSFINKGFGKKIIDTFLTQLIWPENEYCLADPDIRNLRSIKILEKCGFSHHKQVTTRDALGRPVTLQLMIKAKNHFNVQWQTKYLK